MADVSKKGWSDLSSIFNQKASLYSDPNEESNHLNQSSSYSELGGGSYSSYQSSDGARGHSSPIREEPEEYDFLVSNKKVEASPRATKSKADVPVISNDRVSREEETLLNFESDLKPKKSSSSRKKQTLEDEYWADLASK